MELSELVDAQSVKVLASSSSKKRLFQEIGELAETCIGVAAADVVSALQERESLGPTGVGKGVALPHARLNGLSKVHGLFLKLDKPLDFDSVDRQPVDVIFVLLAPENAGVDHLKALALVSRTLRNSNVCAKLRSNSDVSTLHTILTENTTHQAA